MNWAAFNHDPLSKVSADDRRSANPSIVDFDTTIGGEVNQPKDLKNGGQIGVIEAMT